MHGYLLTNCILLSCLYCGLLLPYIDFVYAFMAATVGIMPPIAYSFWLRTILALDSALALAMVLLFLLIRVSDSLVRVSIFKSVSLGL